MRAWIIALSLLLLTAFCACSGGSGGVKTQSPGTSAVAGDLCSLLPQSSIQEMTGYQVTLAQAHTGPGTLHFCTIFLQASGCDQCALSLEDLGAITASANNDSSSYRATLIDANPDAQPSFQDDVVGAGSWLATATSGQATGLKILYFTVSGVAYDLTSPRVAGGLLTADQMVKLAQTVVANSR